MKIADKGITYEEICTELNQQFASRTTIISILDEAVKMGFFIKKTHVHVQKPRVVSTWAFLI